MSAQKLFEHYLATPHSDINYQDINNNEDCDPMAESNKCATEANNVDHLSNPIRFRPLPSQAKSVSAALKSSISEASFVEAPEGAATELPPANNLFDPPQLPDQEIEMNLDDEDHQNMTAGADDLPQEFKEKDRSLETSIGMAHVDAIEWLIEENFSSTIDETVRTALHNIVMRRVKSELSSMTKSNRGFST